MLADKRQDIQESSMVPRSNTYRIRKWSGLDSHDLSQEEECDEKKKNLGHGV